MSDSDKNDPYVDKLMQEVNNHVRLKLGEELLFIYNHFRGENKDLKEFLNKNDENLLYVLAAVSEVPIMFAIFDKEKEEPKEVYEASYQIKVEMSLKILEEFLSRQIDHLDIDPDKFLKDEPKKEDD